jgi:hypothetical protein
MVLRQTANNVDLMVQILPNPLGGRQGTHTIWFNNNNSWAASITPAYVTVPNAASAQLDLVVSGARVRNRGVAIGNLGAWQSSKPIPTGLAEVAGATSSGEFVDVTCGISRAPIAPNQQPPRLYPLQISALVSL